MLLFRKLSLKTPLTVFFAGGRGVVGLGKFTFTLTVCFVNSGIGLTLSTHLLALESSMEPPSALGGDDVYSWQLIPPAENVRLLIVMPPGRFMTLLASLTSSGDPVQPFSLLPLVVVDRSVFYVREL